MLLFDTNPDKMKKNGKQNLTWSIYYVTFISLIQH